MSGTPPLAPALVGRERELERLQALLDGARSRAAAALLVGEPGIGKTRVAAALAASARERGVRVLWGRCNGADPEAYGPWREIARSLARGRDGERDVAEPGAPADVLAHLADEAAPPVGRPLEFTPQEERVRLHDAFARLVAAASGPSGALLVLDDLHWADDASLALLRDLARAVTALPLLLLATYRAEAVGLLDPLASTLAEVERTIPTELIALRSLDAGETALLMQRVLGQEVSARVVQAVQRRTGGVPFFVEQVARQLLEEARGTEAVDAVMPEGARQAVAARIARLPAPARRVLAVAAPFSGAFDVPTLQALADLSEEEVLGAIDEALRARMFRARGGDAYEFAHAIVRDALYEDMNPSRRARLHRRVAETIERVHAGRLREHAAELAFQYHRSARLPGAERGVAHALAAAAQAAAGAAWERRVQLLEIARDLAHGAPAGERSAVLRALAVAQADALDIAAAERSVADAAQALRAAGDEAELPAFLAEAGWSLKQAGAPADLVADLAGRGLALARARDLTWARLKLLPYPVAPIEAGPLSIEVWTGYDPDAVRLARESPDEADRARVLEVMDPRSTAELAALRDEISRWSRPAAAIHGLSVVARSYVYQHCALDEALATAEELGARSRRHGSVAGLTYSLVVTAVVRRERGAHEEAGAALEAARREAARLGPGHRLHRIVDFTVDQGAIFVGADWAELARRNARDAAPPSGPGWMRLTRVGLACYAFARSGDAVSAARWLGSATDLLERVPPRTLNANAAMAYAAHAAWESGDRAAARRLRPLIAAAIAAGVGDYPTLSLDHALGCVLALSGDARGALDAFARSKDRLAAARRLPALALAQRDEATVRRPQGGRPLPAGLSAREAEVLRLVAEGRTNREIAQTLVLSLHTVERHVANVYAKIAARNRAEATAFAYRHGVARPPTT